MKQLQRTAAQRERDLAEIARMYCENLTIRDMQVELGKLYPDQKPPAVGTVHKDLQAVRAAWLESMQDDYDRRKSVELAKISRIEAEAWKAWKRSLEDRVSKQRSQSDGADRATVMTETQTGDPRYLNAIGQCIERRCKMLGLDAPSEVTITEKPTQIVIDWVQADHKKDA